MGSEGKFQGFLLLFDQFRRSPGPEGKPLDFDGFAKVVDEVWKVTRELDSGELIRGVLDRIDGFTGGTPLSDDRTLVVIRRNPIRRT